MLLALWSDFWNVVNWRGVGTSTNNTRFLLGGATLAEVSLNSHIDPDSIPGSVVVETNVNFVGSFRPTKIKILQSLFQNPDIEPFYADETNVSFIAKYKPANLFVNKALQQHYDFPPVVETNVNFLATYKPTKFPLLRALWQNQDIQPRIEETNISFVGKFVPTSIKINKAYYQNPDNQPPVEETNVHFIAKYKPTKPFLLQSLWQNESIEGPEFIAEVGIETYIIGKFTPTNIKLLKDLRQNLAKDTQFSVIETNPHFVGKFKTTKIVPRAYLSKILGDDFSTIFTPRTRTYVHIFG
jgi:hypothetical protein